MNKPYDPQAIETYWNAHWEKEPFAARSGRPYCIILPPPNVTGTLHMGHGLQQTLMDILIRFHHMSGKHVLWQGGSDHAGIATQMVVERNLAKEGLSRQELGREKFLEAMWKWQQYSGNTILSQMRQFGLAMDWSKWRFSLDEQCTQATQTAFIQLYERGLIYQGKRLVNWDPVLHTALSDLEVENKEIEGSLWYIRYPLVNEQNHLVVATTRPETLLGDTAVAVNPRDLRFNGLIGKSVKLPLTDRSIPIIGDAEVDPNFGTGCVKVTPGHDFFDYEMGKRHDLPIINIFTSHATLNDEVPSSYQGLDRFEARNKVVADLASLGLLEKVEAHVLSVPHGDRSGAVLEPYLTKQWYVKMTELVKPAIAAVEEGILTFTPSHWEKTYRSWLENIQDWCISRQLWWGHQIPIWYDENKQAYVGFNEADVRHRHGLDQHQKLTQDPDVLDTWFTSSLWPFATLGWPNETSSLQTFFPTDVLVTGFDIIFFWVARMVIMSQTLTGKIPFRQVFIHGLIRDSHGKKMSKSQGNIIDPLDLIHGTSLEELIKKRTTGLMQPKKAALITKTTQQDFPEGINAYGIDALRFTFCALATPSRFINFDMRKIESYRNFCNKLWNAARFVMMYSEKHTSTEGELIQLNMIDRWIKSRLQKCIRQAHEYLQNYRFDLLAQEIYEFIWNEYCDWYLEFAKVIPEASTRLTLLTVLETILRLVHPIMPFITEEIWQQLAKLVDQKNNNTTILQTAYPEVDNLSIDFEAEQTMIWVKNIITEIRTVRSEMNISPAKKITVLLRRGDEEDREKMEKSQAVIMALAKIDHIKWLEEKAVLEASMPIVINSLEIYIPLSGLIDKVSELARLKKEILKLTKEINQISNKLNNSQYLEKAPEAIVAETRERHIQAEIMLNKLREQVKNIDSIDT